LLLLAERAERRGNFPLRGGEEWGWSPGLPLACPSDTEALRARGITRLTRISRLDKNRWYVLLLEP